MNAFPTYRFIYLEAVRRAGETSWNVYVERSALVGRVHRTEAGRFEYDPLVAPPRPLAPRERAEVDHLLNHLNAKNVDIYP